MANLKRSLEMSTRTTLTATEMREFLSEVPADAEIEIKVQRGDPRDPREAGRREIAIIATWGK